MRLITAVWFKQSLRLLQHELRRGELTIVFLAVVLAVASVFSLNGFSANIKQALVHKSTSFIAADRVLQTSRPADVAISDKAQQFQLKHAEQILMSSMVFADDNMHLVTLKAVSGAYPLRGELLVKSAASGTALPAHAPKRHQVWVEAKLLTMLHITLGQQIDIGNASFTVAGLLQQIPDASFSIFNPGPTVLMNIDDMPATQLIQPASRVTYRYLFAGSQQAIEAFEQWLKPQVNDTQWWYDIKSRQSPLANALNRAEKYLSLASLLGIILAAIAVAVASRRYGQRHTGTVAVFKAMGASKQHVTRLYLTHWTLLSAMSIASGLVLGLLMLRLGLLSMADSLGQFQPASLLSSALLAGLTGCLAVLAFALVPMRELLATPPLAVLRLTDRLPSLRYGLQYLPAFIALLLLLYVFSNDMVLSLVLFGASALIVLMLTVCARLLMSAGRSVGSQAGQAFHLAIANLKRRAAENSVQLVSFTLAIHLLLLLVVLRHELLNEWQAQLPEFTANRFLVNVAETEVADVNRFIAEQKLHASKLYPVVRARLVSVNDEALLAPEDEQTQPKPDAQVSKSREGLGRELNLTWLQKLPADNELLEGEAWHDDDIAQVSVEQGVAKRLHLKLGDKLSFELGNQRFTVPVTSIRKVNWQSLKPNFFMIFNPKVLQDYPATYIASLFVDSNEDAALQRFLSQHPTVTMIDIDAMLNQLRNVIAQVSLAIAFILLLVLLAGCLVLIAQVQASMQERERELAILRTLGASGSLLRNAILFEFVAQGLMAGLLAGVTMEIAVYFLQTQVFNMSASFHGEFWLLGMAAGAAFVGTVGMLSCWRLLHLSSVTLIRRTM